MATSTGPGLPAGEHNKSVNPNAGPYIGIVKGYGDDTGMGRIAVYIPALVGQRLSSEINPAKKHDFTFINLSLIFQ